MENKVRGYSDNYLKSTWITLQYFKKKYDDYQGYIAHQCQKTYLFDDHFVGGSRVEPSKPKMIMYFAVADDILDEELYFTKNFINTVKNNPRNMHPLPPFRRKELAKSVKEFRSEFIQSIKVEKMI